jgi:hypothetical protein
LGEKQIQFGWDGEEKKPLPLLLVKLQSNAYFSAFK